MADVSRSRIAGLWMDDDGKSRDWRGVGEAWSDVILSFLAVLSITIVLLIYIKKFHCNKELNNSIKDNKTQKLLQNYLLLSLIMSILYIYIKYYVSVLSILIFDERYNKHCFYQSLVIGFYGFHRMITYAFFIKRLTETFKESVYSVSSLKSKCLNGYICLYLVVVVVNIILQYILGGYLCHPSTFTGVVLFAGLLDIIFSIIITYMFTSRLKALLLKSHKTNIQNYIVKKLTLLSMYIIIHVMCF